MPYNPFIVVKSMNMKFCKSLPVILVVVAATFASCGKMDMATPDTTPVNPGTPPPSGNNGDSTNSSIQGTWNFTGAVLNTVSTMELMGMKSISYSYYTTVNNSGTIVIDDSNFKITGLTYTINGTIRTKTFVSDMDSSDIVFPYSVVIDPYTAESPYKRVGEDSIYFESSMVESSIYGNAPAVSQPQGGKISWSGDTLIITNAINQVDDGMLTTGTTVMKMVKK